MNKVVALDNISFRVDNGEFVAIMGSSGSGKSTLLNVIGGLNTINDGEVVLNGNNINKLAEDALVSSRRGEFSYIFQQYHLLPFLTTFENILLPLLFRSKRPERETGNNLLEPVR